MESSSVKTNVASKYIKDFEFLFIPIKVEELCDRAQNGNLRHCQFRSLCWRYFLHCLPEDYNEWLVKCEKDRLKYVEIKEKHLAFKLSVEEQQSSSQHHDTLLFQQEKNPSGLGKNKELDDEQRFIKATSQCDHQNIFRTIERDVIRTFPDMEFFRQTEMQGILENVLFNYASENPHLSYKQGMHELLAILLYVLHTDSQNCLINYEGGYANETIATLLDLKYLEHDVFQLFCSLMESIETWYQNDEILAVTSAPQQNKNDNTDFPNKSAKQQPQQMGSVLGNKLNMISKNVVKRYDLELFNHLEALQIAPQIYGIRWMRLLFSREFEFLDLLTIWDALICDQSTMSLTEFIFASMLITIREELVNGDYTDCLNNLMRHQFKDVQYVIKLALHLRDPIDNPRPGPQKQSATQNYHSQQHVRYPPETSLTSKLSHQYIKSEQQFRQVNEHKAAHLLSATGKANIVYDQSSDMAKRYSHRMNNPAVADSRDSRKIFMTSKPHLKEKQRSINQADQSFGSALSGIRFLNPASTSTTSSNKFLPNINKFVSSIGNNSQDKRKSSQNTNLIRNHSQQPKASIKGAANTRTPQQQYHHQTSDQMLLAIKPIKEYEMREMQSSNSSEFMYGTHESKVPLSSISSSRHALNISTETYDDLPSIVDYCWRLLSEQIDSLQRCLPKEKSLHSEDEIFVALAQLKKVRDVLKGSLRLDDELDSPPGGSKI